MPGCVGRVAKQPLPSGSVARDGIGAERQQESTGSGQKPSAAAPERSRGSGDAEGSCSWLGDLWLRGGERG